MWNPKVTKQLELETFGLSDAENDDFGEDKDTINEMLSSHFISKSLRENIYLFLSSPESSIPARVWSIVHILFCVGYMLSFIVETMPRWVANPSIGFFIANTIFVAFFIFEWIARFIFCSKKLYFIIDVPNICDIIAIIPYWVEIGLAGTQGSNPNWTWIRVFFLFKIPRLIALVRQDGITVIRNTLRYAFPALVIFFTLLAVTMIISATFVFYAETSYEYFDYNDRTWYYDNGTRLEGSKAFFQSIPHALWWSIVTITTLGYGDTYPISPLGRLVGGITIVIGYVTLLFPLSFLGGYFLTAYTESQNLRKVQKKKKITEKTKNEHFVPAMRGTYDNVQKIEKLVDKLKYQISSAGLDRECKDLTKTVELFNTNWTSSFFDYQDDPVDSEDDE